MSVTEQDWREEQQRVNQVVEEIDRRVISLEQQLGEVKADIVDIRKNFWDDVTVAFDDPDDVIESYLALRQQSEVLSERERLHRHALKQLKTLLRLKQSTYFGRIDFREDGERQTEQIYLGIASMVDEENDQFLVYDWRAPVSSLYYDYAPGPAQYETPSGTITGEMELKRQFIIRDSQIRSLFDTGVTIGDELLQEVLGKHADSQMKSIVATIQKEQNAIIRDERHRLLVVQGAAGSGKTSAALQRVAYLLYRYRETLSAENIVLFSPNPMFNSYVATVLPELGEENMQQTTFQEYLEHRLGKMFHLEDPFTQMETVLTAMNEPGYTARVEGIQYKASTDYMHVLEKYIESLGVAGLIFRDVKFNDEVLIPAERIKEQFHALESSLPIPNRMQLLSDSLLQELRERMREEQEKPWVDDEIDLLDKETYLRAYQKLRKQKKYTDKVFDYHDRERDLLAEMVVKDRFRPLRRRIKGLYFIDMPAVYQQLFAQPEFISQFARDGVPANWATICAQTVARLDEAELFYEDATPYLYLKERLEGIQINNSVRHVFVDEAQDYSPFQFEFIKRLFPRSKMTVLGDLNQAIYAHAAAGDGFAPLSALYGPEETGTIILTRSYRSTREIVEFTRCMIAGGEAIQPFNRPGDKPTVTYATDSNDLVSKITARIQSLKSAGHANIAVICKTAEESREAYEALQGDVESLRLIKKETTNFESGTVVIPAYLAKGVEFDAVILYNASQEQYGRESERKLFYTACTRAMHELHLYAIGEISKFVSEVSPDTYVVEKGVSVG